MRCLCGIKTLTEVLHTFPYELLSRICNQQNKRSYITQYLYFYKYNIPYINILHWLRDMLPFACTLCIHPVLNRLLLDVCLHLCQHPERRKDYVVPFLRVHPVHNKRINAINKQYSLCCMYLYTRPWGLFLMTYNVSYAPCTCLYG